MNKKLSLALISLLAFTIMGIVGCCESQKNCLQCKQEISLRSHFDGERTIRKMKTSQFLEGSGTSRYSFFLFGGGGGENLSFGTQDYVTFAWEFSQGCYKITRVPLTKIEVNFNDHISTPTVRFDISIRTEHQYGHEHQKSKLRFGKTQEYLDAYLGRVIITCREKDWLMDVRLPMNKAEEDK